MAASRYRAIGLLKPKEKSKTLLALEISGERAQPVVLVPLPEAIAEEPAFVAQVRRETERAAVLEHPHIIKVYGVADAGGTLARVVEFADGESLRRVIQAGRLPPAIAARVAVDAAQGVHFAHVAGNDDGTPLVHGELRPETLLLCYSGNAKVTGYGAGALASLSGIADRTRYSAPEQVIGGRASMSVQTDVYQLGLLLFELLTGRKPFADAPRLEDAILTWELPLDTPDIPDPLRAVVARATAKKGPARHESALQLLEEIQAALPPAAPDEVSRWLSERFQKDPDREQWLRIIDKGIADFAREQWLAKNPPEPVAAPAPQPVQAPTPPAPAAPAPAPVAAAPAPAAATAVKPPPAPPAQPAAAPPTAVAPSGAPVVPASAPVLPVAPPRGPSNAAIYTLAFSLLVASAAVIAWAWQASLRDDEREPGTSIALPAVPPDATAAAPVAVAPEAADASTPEPPASAANPGKAPPARTANKAKASTAEPRAAAVEPKPEAAATTLALSVEPAVDVSIDGKKAGRAPLTAKVAPGTRRLVLADKALGIKVEKTLEIQPGANEQSIVLGKGAVGVSGPPESQVIIDGRKVATLPLTKDIEVWEGTHHIIVDMGAGRWQQTFELEADDRMQFSVGLQAEEMDSEE